jgi:glycosyltransferase involved in cell wall biosynthesis
MIRGTLSLVLPAHNEEENIYHVVAQALRTLPRFADAFEIIVVNDGSTDSTGSRVRQISGNEPRVRLVEHPKNFGYGAALRSGFAASTGDWVMIMDSDRQFDIGDLVYLAPLTSHYDLVAGYRIQRSDPFHRTLFGKTFRLAMRVLFGIQLKDIDCAFKLIRGEILRTLALESNGAMISTELMARWARVGGTWTQVGVHHYPRAAGQQSGGSFRVILRAMRDVPRLWVRLQREPIETIAGREVEPDLTGLSPAAAISILAVVLGILTLIAARIFRQH